MPHVIRVPANASTAAIHSALAGTRARDVALAFPLGAPCRAGTAEAMRSLHSQCRALQKDVVILGGDEHLRAVAVAAGFPAATSLAEWVTTFPRVAAITGPLYTENDTWGALQFALVPFEDEQDERGDPFDPFNDVPPGYVLELMARDGKYGAPDDDDDLFPESADEPSIEDTLTAAHERYEEHITRAIRHTGGLSLSRPTQPPVTPFSTFPSSSPDETGSEGSHTL